MQLDEMGLPIAEDADYMDVPGYSEMLANMLGRYLREIYSWGCGTSLACSALAATSSDSFFMYDATGVREVTRHERPTGQANDPLDYTYVPHGLVGVPSGVTVLMWGGVTYQCPQNAALALAIGDTTTPTARGFTTTVDSTSHLITAQANQYSHSGTGPVMLTNSDSETHWYGVGGRCAVNLGATAATFGIMVLGTGATLPPTA